MGSAELIQKLRSTAGALARQGNHEARDLMNQAADALETKANRVADSDTALIKRLLSIAEISIVNQKNDVAVILDAADRIEELSERVAIMTENFFQDATEDKHEFLKKTFHIGPGANVDLWPALGKISQDEGKITMDEMLKGGAS